jgi:hypothetical protein
MTELLETKIPTGIPWWVATIVILGALLTVTGGILALVRPEILAGASMNQAAYVYASYLVSRDLALAAMLLATLVLRSYRVLTGLMLLTVLTQMIDAIVDATTGRASLLPAILVFAVAYLIAAARIFGRLSVSRGSTTSGSAIRSLTHLNGSSRGS